MSGLVAVIDVGSNSIKLLVAARAADGGVQGLHTRTLDVRISAGLSAARPRLAPAGMERGLEAIRALLAEADGFGPAQTTLVATSAVRDAENGGEFRHQVRDATGRELRILSGEEEANLIGRGLAADPALRGLRDFYVFDLGGGSLECLAFRARRVEQALSLRLGCVRLTEKFVADPAAPFSAADREAIARHTRAELHASGFRFSLPAEALAVGTGGSVTTARAILGARAGRALEQTEPVVTVSQLDELLDWLGGLPLAARRDIRGLPPPRADVFPTALATLAAVAGAGGFPAYHNSVYNLRYGLADEVLR